MFHRPLVRFILYIYDYNEILEFEETRVYYFIFCRIE
jgi:hypothetical protein